MTNETESADATKPTAVKLPPHLDLSAGEEIAEALEQARGMPVNLMAGEVKHLGGIVLQLLAGARAQWAKDEVAFRICDASDGFNAGLKLLGVPDGFFEQGETA